MGNTNAEFVEKRKAGLEKYLNEISTLPGLTLIDFNLLIQNSKYYLIILHCLTFIDFVRLLWEYLVFIYLFILF